MSEHRIAPARYKLRDGLVRRTIGEITCPMGVFPCRPGASLREGYEGRYLTARDEFGDQYEYRIVLDATRIESTLRQLMDELLPEEAHAIFEEFSFDAWRETDTWMSDDVLPRSRILRAWDTYGAYFAEDGKNGFGALSYSPPVEVFMEEHGALYVACGLEMKAAVEDAIDRLGLREVEALRAIDNFEHQHVDILHVDPETDHFMDEVDIKFSVIESLGLQPTNRDEGKPERNPCPFWLQIELDLAFSPGPHKTGAFVNFGVTAENHTEALYLVEEEVKKVPGALIARVIEFYRMADGDIGDDIAPKERGAVLIRGVWHHGELHYWS